MANSSLRFRLWGTLHLPYGGMGKGEMSVLWLWQLGELGMRSRERKKWYCIQPIAALGRADLAPKLGSTIKLILLVRIQAKGTQDQEVLPPPLHICHAVAWERKKNVFPPFAPWHLQQLWELAQRQEEWEGWPCPSLAAAHGKAGTLELPLWQECMWAGPVVVRVEELHPPPPSKAMG